MSADDTAARNYMAQLFQMTDGDVSAQVSMYDVGAAMGLDKAEAGRLAEELIGDGFVEVKTLSGGIGITVQGIEEARAAGTGGETNADLDMGKGPVLETKGREALTAVMTQIQSHIANHPGPYERLETMVIDLKTLEVQMLSPAPKTDVLREVLRSLHAALTADGSSGLSDKIAKMIAD